MVKIKVKLEKSFLLPGWLEECEFIWVTDQFMDESSLSQEEAEFRGTLEEAKLVVVTWKKLEAIKEAFIYVNGKELNLNNSLNESNLLIGNPIEIEETKEETKKTEKAEKEVK